MANTNNSVASVTAIEIVRAARQWAGTPYHHQASCKGVGTDCLGLVRGVWREVYGQEPQSMVPYTRDWTATGAETLLTAAARHFQSIEPAQICAGDIAIFRYRTGMAAKHCAILTSPDTFIHAMEGVPVSEVPFANWWQRRLAGAFRFPGVEN
ncbi:MAG: C40 family peptidase [Alphaproteobacteria bacterium]|nr:C40 family peptidase [Alphaproteobacteria bacterium]